MDNIFGNIEQPDLDENENFDIEKIHQMCENPQRNISTTNAETELELPHEHYTNTSYE